MPEAFPLLRRCHLFVGVADNEVKDLAAHFQPTEVAAEEFVFKQGEPGDGFYIIQSGQVEITAVNPVSGKTRKISTLVEGDYFGEMALVRRGARWASVKALKALKLFKLTNEEFDQFVLGNPKIKPNLELVMRARAYARKANFKWLLPNEIVYVVTLRHPVFLLGMMWLPGLVILPIVFGHYATTSQTGLQIGIFLVGLCTVAQFSFWGNYLPRVFPVHLRGTGESFAANIGGRMIGTSFALVASQLSLVMPGDTDGVRMAAAATVIGTGVYLANIVFSFFLPEPSAENLPE